MKFRLFYFLRIGTVLAAALAAHGAAASTTNSVDAKASAPASAEKVVPKSAFLVPAKAEEGRDPFFPTSDRLFAAKTQSTVRKTSTSAAPTVVLNGFSSAAGRPLAMINGYTFGEGEEAQVNTPSGRVRVHCIEITGQRVVLEVNGERRELRFEDR